MPLSPPTQRRRRPAGDERTGLAGRDFLLLLAATVGTFSNYAPLLSVAPLWSAQGGSGNAGVGAVTGVTMAATVGVQLCMRWLLRRLSLRQTLVFGALLLGLPTFAYPLSTGLGWVLAVSAVRGVGFGMVAVAGSALVAELVPAHSRGKAVGWYGVAVGLPQVLCLPLGVWLAEHIGFTPVFVAAGALSVLAAAAIRPQRRQGESGGSRAAKSGEVPLRPFGRPFTVLITAACALGGVTSFLPLALSDSTAAPVALFLLSGAVVVGRWVAGVVSDRVGTGRLLVPSVLACVVGMGGFGLATAPFGDGAVLSAVAAAVYGLGFGALQNDTLVIMFRRAGPHGHGAASTAWNMAYDAGTGIGAMAVGVTSHALGVDGSFTAAAVLILLAAPLALRDARTENRGEGPSAAERPAETPTHMPQ
ncbi:MFS transporter [Streptomyces sp. NPDC050161]|uniref:MFS transporter n=1 Tax=Streptomyces sp. NPDC050161 TaxID=3365604 RepID=UPI003795FD95